MIPEHAIYKQISVLLNRTTVMWIIEVDIKECNMIGAESNKLKLN